MKNLTVANVEADTDVIFLPLIRELVDAGMTTEELDTRISEIIDEQVDSAATATARMNFIGGLRACGWIITGGRHGGTIYKVVNWKEKKDKVPVQDWEGEPKEIYDWVHTLRPFTVMSYNLWETYTAMRDPKEQVHENSFLVFWAYLIARNKGFWFIEDGNVVIIRQKFVNRPIFDILCVNRPDPEWLIQLAFKLGKSSIRSPQIINVSGDQIHQIHPHHPEGNWGKRSEAIYDLNRIACHPEQYLNKRAMSQFRARQRDTTFVLEPPVEDQMAVIEAWKIRNEYKHRQLAIGRDRIAVNTEVPKKIVYGGNRKGVPVIHHLFHPLANRDDTVALLNEKSLNYSTNRDGSPLRGGKAGLSDFNQIMACRELARMGFKFMQSGGIDGGGVGLPAKKMKYSKGELVTSYTFHTRCEESKYAKLEVE